MDGLARKAVQRPDVHKSDNDPGALRSVEMILRVADRDVVAPDIARPWIDANALPFDAPSLQTAKRKDSDVMTQVPDARRKQGCLLAITRREPWRVADPENFHESYLPFVRRSALDDDVRIVG